MNCDQCILVRYSLFCCDCDNNICGGKFNLTKLNVCVFQISGESGSGKTEAAKLTLQYLAAVTSHHRECHAVKYQILQSNPVLEGESTGITAVRYKCCQP